MRLVPYSSFLLEQASRWVHTSVNAHSTEFSEHTSFLAKSVAVALITSVLLPIAALTLSGMPLAIVLGCAIIASALLSSLWVSKTGKLSVATTAISMLTCAALSILIAATGGWSSPYIVLCAAIPLLANIGLSTSKLMLTAVVAVTFTLAMVFQLELQALAQSFGAVPAVNLNHLVIATVLLFSVTIFAVQKFNRSMKSEKENTSHARSRWNLLSENGSGLIAKHDATGKTLFVGANCRAITGTSASSLHNSGYLEKVHLQDRVIFLKALSDAAHTGNDQMCEIRIRYKGQGQQIWKTLEIICRPQRSKTNGQMEIISTANDVSERNTLRAELASAEEEIANATIAQRNFLATISHELRTPLNAIIGFSDIMHKELFGRLEDEKHREYTGLIQNSGQHLLHVVNDMLDMTRIESGKYELNLSTFDLVSVSDATLGMLRPLAEKNATRIACDVPANLPEIKADQNACQQILLNLVSNAIKFSPDDGLVSISARQHGRSIRIQVKDNGIGIPAAFMSSLGKPFEQADKNLNRKFEGSGLGVSVVMGLVELHGGKIDFASTEGKGTTVTLTLPIQAVVSRPMPANSQAGLVHLSAANRVQKTTSIENSVDHKGEARARVSA